MPVEPRRSPAPEREGSQMTLPVDDHAAITVQQFEGLEVLRTRIPAARGLIGNRLPEQNGISL
jgi:hypothetical protein